MIFRLYFILGAFILCSCGKNAEQKRPREAWVIRSVLDQHPRILSAALSDQLWVAYNTQTGRLFKAWSGGINFDGPVYTSAHGPQPTTQGYLYVAEPLDNPFTLSSGESGQKPDVIYHGHEMQENKLTLRYTLKVDGTAITIEEQPEYLGRGGSAGAFERRFSVSGIPDGISLFIEVAIPSANALAAIESTSELQPAREEGDKSSNALLRKMRLTNGENSIVLPLEKGEVDGQDADQLSGEDEVMALMARSDCNTCHNKDVKTVGPSYNEIAKRYEDNAERTEYLVSKVIAGGAGNWGDVPMTPHPSLPREDAARMVSYILGLDSESETRVEEVQEENLMPEPDFEVQYAQIEATTDAKEAQGLALNVYQFSEPLSDFPEITGEMLPVFSGYINALHVPENKFGGMEQNFAVHATGFLNIRKETNVVFRLVSDDGSRLFIDNKLVVDNGGSHGLDPRDGELIVKPGKHPIRVEYFQGSGGKGLSLQWRPHGSDEFAVIPPSFFSYSTSAIKPTSEAPSLLKKKDLDPGDGAPLTAVHPAFDLAQARPDDFQPKVGGMDFLPDGRMILTTWDSLGSVYLLDGVSGDKPKDIKIKRIAFGLAEPLGVKVVDGQIYVLQKQELTRLVDLNGDDIIDRYETVCNGWKVSANFHEFAFGLLYKDGYFYGTLATAINPGGASTKPQIPDRGKVVKISKEDGSFSFVASGLRTPNGIGFGVDNEIYIADNQGDWLPASKIVHLQENAWYGSRSVDFEGTKDATETLPVVWLPQDEIGNSPSQPARLNVGPYQNQMIHGEVTHGGIKRVFAEKVNGQYQGAVFRFTQGLEAGVNRLAWGPDGSLYVGGIGSTGNWGHYGKLQYGLQRLTYNNKPVFEMLAVRAQSDGLEIEFTEPLKEGSGNAPDHYSIMQWYYLPTENYGGPKMNLQTLKVKAVSLTPDRKRAKLVLEGMKTGNVIYVRLLKDKIASSSGRPLWSTEAWYTMNSIPGRSLP